jgi:hypothetical protein
MSTWRAPIFAERSRVDEATGAAEEAAAEEAAAEEAAAEEAAPSLADPTGAELGGGAGAVGADVVVASGGCGAGAVLPHAIAIDVESAKAKRGARREITS